MPKKQWPTGAQGATAVAARLPIRAYMTQVRIIVAGPTHLRPSTAPRYYVKEAAPSNAWVAA